jgi:1,4-dihydroxy-2-naphthoyl-CoA hydrolase
VTLLEKIKSHPLPFADFIGVIFESADPDRVTAKMLVRPELCTAGAIIHGGALMALADTVGAAATFINLPEGAKGTTTIESKTNFLTAAPLGVMLSAIATPIHRGRRTQVWQTRIEAENGRLVAMVTQTQMVL